MSAPDLMGDDFRAWFEARLVPLHAWAFQNVAQGRGITPGVVVFSPAHNEMVLLPLPEFDSVSAKDLAVTLHGMVASLEIGRQGAIMLSEAWVGDDRLDEAGRERANREGLEHMPGTREAVVWNALRGDRQLIAIAMIDRARKQLEPVKPIIDPKRSFISGRMVREQRKGH